MSGLHILSQDSPQRWFLRNPATQNPQIKKSENSDQTHNRSTAATFLI